MFHIIPINNHDQSLRIKRFLMACGSSLLWSLIVFYCYTQNLLRMNLVELLGFFGLTLIFNILIYISIRTGFNLRFKDPSMTEIQMIGGSIGAIIIAYYLTQARGIIFMNFIGVFLFGTFRLNLRQFTLLSIFSILGYGFAIALLHTNYPQTIDIKIELIYLSTLGAGLIWFSFMGSYLNNLRIKLNRVNNDLSNAMHVIKQQSIHDDLTGVYNRRHLFQILNREKKLADREEHLFSLCIFDLDDFKKVNDTYGHFFGDIVLKILAEKVKESIRQHDYIARYGGEEFVLILAYPDLADAYKCTERIRETISKLTFPGLPENFHITISMGLTRYQKDETIDALLVRADYALYHAKGSGKNKTECMPSTPIDRLNN